MFLTCQGAQNNTGKSGQPRSWQGHAETPLGESGWCEREGQRAQENTGVSDADGACWKEGCRGYARVSLTLPCAGAIADAPATRQPWSRPSSAACSLCVGTSALTPLGLFLHGSTDSTCLPGLLRKSGVKRQKARFQELLVHSRCSSTSRLFRNRQEPPGPIGTEMASPGQSVWGWAGR